MKLLKLALIVVVTVPVLYVTLWMAGLGYEAFTHRNDWKDK